MEKYSESSSHSIDRVIALTPLLEAMAKQGRHDDVRELFLRNRETVLKEISDIDSYRAANRLDYILSKSISIEGSTIEHVLELVQIGTSLANEESEMYDFACENGLWTVELSIELLAVQEKIGLSKEEVSQVISESIEAMNNIAEISMTKSSRLNTLTRNSISVYIGRKMVECLKSYYNKEIGLAKSLSKFNETNQLLKQLILKANKLE